MLGARDILKYKCHMESLKPKPVMEVDPHYIETIKKKLEQIPRSEDENPKKRIRELEMHIATLQNQILKPRPNIVDECLLHRCKRVVDRENAKFYCPQCGESGTFQSHIFDHKDNEDQSHHTAQSTTIAVPSPPPIQKTPLQVMEYVVTEYAKIHTDDPGKVTVQRTSQILKKHKPFAKHAKKHSARISAELRCDAIFIPS